MTKLCTKCGAEKELSCFSKNKKSKDGLRHHCKLCESKRSRRYRIANADKIKESSRKYYLNNADNFKEYGKKYSISAADKIKKRQKNYRISNAVQIKEGIKMYQLSHGEKIRATKRKYYATNPKAKIASQNRRTKSVQQLQDCYVNRLLVKQTNGILKASEIPNELIETKRSILLLKRKTKKQ